MLITNFSSLKIMIKAVLLDLGNTLVDSTVYINIEKELELPFWSKHGYKGDLRRFKEIKRKIQFQFSKKAFRNKKEKYLWDIIAAKNLGISPDKEIITEGYELAKNYFTRKAKLRKGTIKLLKYLKSKNIKIILVSNNWSDIANNVIDFLDIRKYFDSIIISDEVGAIKSELKPFNAALEKTKVNPQECIMIGDDKEDSFCRKLGIHFAWLDVYNDGTKMEYDYRIKELLEIKNIMEEIARQKQVI